MNLGVLILQSVLFEQYSFIPSLFFYYLVLTQFSLTVTHLISELPPSKSSWIFNLLLFQAVMRHYIGKKHGVLDRFVKENLARIRKENGGKIPGAVITPTIEVQL